MLNLALKHYQGVPFLHICINKPNSRAVHYHTVFPCHVQPLWPLVVLTHRPFLCLWSPVPLVWIVLCWDLKIFWEIWGDTRAFSHLMHPVAQVWVKAALVPGVQEYLHPCLKVIRVEAWRVNPP